MILTIISTLQLFNAFNATTLSVNVLIVRQNLSVRIVLSHIILNSQAYANFVAHLSLHAVIALLMDLSVTLVLVQLMFLSTQIVYCAQLSLQIVQNVLQLPSAQNAILRTIQKPHLCQVKLDVNFVQFPWRGV